MAGKVDNATRDMLITAFRERVCEKVGAVPLIHQRRWWCATDGLVLHDQEYAEDGVLVQLSDKTTVTCATSLRPHGRAKVVADLGAFKSGKSFGTGLWISGFGAVPGARVTLVGLEYSMAEPEFNYVCDFLLSSDGMGLKYASLTNRPRQGDMFLELQNGARFEAKSWERKDSLKGKEIDAYVFVEAYQLPGMECYTSVKQNLIARDGYAIFPTTPDRPWLKEIHDKGHGDATFPEWECVCGVARYQNPHTYSARDEAQDKELLTKEKFEIAHHGQMGDFVGRVFSYTKGSRTFSKGSHPQLFRGDDLVIPDGWEVVSAADTGTYYTALNVAFAPNGDAFVIDEFPNYRYVAGTAERDESITIPQWANRTLATTLARGGRSGFWADTNSQFKGELKNYGMALMPAKAPVETRTEIAREYFEHGRIWLAPWITVLPYEIENASWPEEASLSGKFGRLKTKDHTLDCLEHILARRPLGKIPVAQTRKGSWAAGMGLKKQGAHGNVHLGRQ